MPVPAHTGIFFPSSQTSMGAARKAITSPSRITEKISANKVIPTRITKRAAHATSPRRGPIGDSLYSCILADFGILSSLVRDWEICVCILVRGMVKGELFGIGSIFWPGKNSATENLRLLCRVLVVLGKIYNINSHMVAEFSILWFIAVENNGPTAGLRRQISIETCGVSSLNIPQCRHPNNPQLLVFAGNNWQYGLNFPAE